MPPVSAIGVMHFPCLRGDSVRRPFQGKKVPFPGPNGFDHHFRKILLMTGEESVAARQGSERNLPLQDAGASEGFTWLEADGAPAQP